MSKYQGAGWKKSIYDLLVFFTAHLFIVFVGILYLRIFSDWNDSALLRWLVYLLIGGIILALFWHVYVKIIVKIADEKIDKILPKSTLSKRSAYILMSLFGALFLISLYLAFENKLRLPEDLENTKYLYSKIEKKYPNNNGINIIYNNDKYIFIKIIDKKDNILTEIFELKELFK